MPFRGPIVHIIYFPNTVFEFCSLRDGGNHDAGSTSWCLSANVGGRWHRLSPNPKRNTHLLDSRDACNAFACLWTMKHLTQAKQETTKHNELVDTWTTSLTESARLWGRALEKQNLYRFRTLPWQREPFTGVCACAHTAGRSLGLRFSALHFSPPFLAINFHSAASNQTHKSVKLLFHLISFFFWYESLTRMCLEC